jgi:hypothetical protein
VNKVVIHKIFIAALRKILHWTVFGNSWTHISTLHPDLVFAHFVHLESQPIRAMLRSVMIFFSPSRQTPDNSPVRPRQFRSKSIPCHTSDVAVIFIQWHTLRISGKYPWSESSMSCLVLNVLRCWSLSHVPYAWSTVYANIRKQAVTWLYENSMLP